MPGDTAPGLIENIPDQGRPPRRFDFWTRDSWHPLVPFLIVAAVAWGDDITNSLSYYLGYTTPVLGVSEGGIAGSWIKHGLEVLAAVIVALAFVSPGELGLGAIRNRVSTRRVIRPRRIDSPWLDKPGGELINSSDTPGHRVGMLAFLGMIVGSYVVIALDTVGLPSNPGNARPDTWPDLMEDVIYAVGAGLHEEIPAAAMLILLLRARWSPWMAIGAVMVLRVGFHAYLGWSWLLGGMIFTSVMALLFLRYRRVAPLVVAHSLFNLASYVRLGVVIVYPAPDWLMVFAIMAASGFALITGYNAIRRIKEHWGNQAAVGEALRWLAGGVTVSAATLLVPYATRAGGWLTAVVGLGVPLLAVFLVGLAIGTVRMVRTVVVAATAVLLAWGAFFSPLFLIPATILIVSLLVHRRSRQGAPAYFNE